MKHIIDDDGLVYAVNLSESQAEAALAREIQSGDTTAGICEISCQNGCAATVEAYVLDGGFERFFCTYCGDTTEGNYERV